MQANHVASKHVLSPTEVVRRAQIIDATIATVAEHGYARTTFARIAERSGLSSTGLISYHFASKADLLQQVVATVVSGISRYVSGRMRNVASPADALRTYILATTGYIGDNRARMQALLEITMFGNAAPGGQASHDAGNAVESILRDGQRVGVFRPDFDPGLLAGIIQHAIEMLPMLLMAQPSTSAEAFGNELATTFALATERRPT